MDIIRDKYGRPRVYLEDDCPIEILSIESQRERGASSALPPLYFLHVWWARRPLTVSRASIIGSLLPAGYNQEDFLKLMGIEGDPVSDKARINAANMTGTKLKVGFTFKRGFCNPVSKDEMKKMKHSIQNTWGGKKLMILDSFAGGGSIPFESVRMGFDTLANELNPVACVIERATIEYPKIFGLCLKKEIEEIGEKIAIELQNDLTPFFPKNPGEQIFGYIWVRTVRCSKCNLSVPLSPNWWLSSEEKIGFQPIPPPTNQGDTCSFNVISVHDGFNPDIGTVKRGVATCPRCGNVIEGDFIKEEAKAGRLGDQLAVIGYKINGRTGRFFRTPSQSDLTGFELARERLTQKLPEWEMQGLVPKEELPDGLTTRQIMNYGVRYFDQFFSERQLLVHLTTLEKINNYPWGEIKDEKRREALRIYLHLAFDKCVDYNSLQSRLDVTRVVIKNTFDRHDYAPVWSHGEIDGSGVLFKFGYSQISDAYSGICKLIEGSEGSIQFINGDAGNMKSLSDNSINLVSIDPPYYDNVMYSESADFFYVWMKRSLANVLPTLFTNELTNKDQEAVANVTHFNNIKRGMARTLASRDYEAKMLLAFKEMHRVLRDDGVMTVMFTHKRVEAWDTLSQALLEAGFMITATWPIHTESENSLHQAKKNAAASTILLICRKKVEENKISWWDEVQLQVDDAVKKHAERFASQGLRGQDTFIACFGPALQVLSEHWPVKRKDGTNVRPDEALDRARTIVSAWFMDRIAEGKAENLDPVTRFYILSWYIQNAREYRYDEARKLGLSLNVEVDDLMRCKIMEKKGDFVRMLKPQERARGKGLNPDVKSYDNVLDLVQSAMCAYDAGKSLELTRFHQRTGALATKGYKEAIAYLLDVLPRTDEVVEYKLLDEMWAANYTDQIKRKAVKKTDITGKKLTSLDSFTGESNPTESINDPSERSEEVEEMDEEEQ